MTDPDVGWPALTEGEVQLETDSDELLWRQVHPEFAPDGVLTSRGFRPGQHDDGCLSTVRSSVLTAAAAQAHHEAVGLKTAGTWAVTPAESAQAGTRAVDDSTSPGLPTSAPPGHTYLDFRPLSKKGVKDASVALLLAAVARGRQHP